jgi:hypothetical protein
MKKTHKRGSVLATVLMLACLLAIITAVVANSALHNYKTTNLSGDTATTRYVAFAGIQHAMLYLKDDTTYNSSFEERVPGNEGLRYKVTVKNNKDGRYPVAEVPLNCARIEVEVVEADRRTTERVLSGMVGTAAWKPTAFDNAATAKSLVALTDSAKTMAFDFWKYKDDKREHRDTGYDSGYVDPLAGPGSGPSGTPSPGPGGGDKAAADVQSSQFVSVASGAKIEGDMTAPPVETEGSTFGIGGQPAVSDPSVDPGTGAGTGTVLLAAAQQSLAQIAPDLAPLLSNLSKPLEGVQVMGKIKVPTASPEFQKASPPYNPKEAIDTPSHFPETVRRDHNGHPVKDQHGNEIRDPGSLPPKAYKSITVPQGEKLVLTSGRYYVSDEFTVDGEILINDGGRGDVLVYVGKKMIVNGRVNFQGDPAKLQVYFTDEDEVVDPETGEPVPKNPENPSSVRGFSTLEMNPGSKATMVVQGANLLARLKDARLLGSVSGKVIHLGGNSTIEYDTNLKGRQMAGASPWKLEGVHEKAGK